MLEVVPKGIDDLLFTAQLISADGTVDDFVVRACFGAACRYFVFTNGLTFGMTERFELFCRGVCVLFAVKRDFCGIGLQPFRFAFSGRCDYARDRASGCSCGLLVAAAARAGKRCRCGRITFPRPFGLAVLMSERITILKDLLSGFTADRAALEVGCACGTCCSRDFRYRRDLQSHHTQRRRSRNSQAQYKSRCRRCDLFCR